MSLANTLRLSGALKNDDWEQHVQAIPKQVVSLSFVCKNAKNIMEIGFNAGHSCEVFLTCCHPESKVTTFDLMNHSYSEIGKNHFEKYYPGRVEFIEGTSEQQIPLYSFMHRNKTFDVIFIDGSRKYEVVYGDILTSKALAHEDTIIIMNVIVSRPSHMLYMNDGPMRAWKEAIQKGHVMELSQEDYNVRGQGMAIGRYCS